MKTEAGRWDCSSCRWRDSRTLGGGYPGRTEAGIWDCSSCRWRDSRTLEG
ncbi:MAG: hypothetical protein R2744_06435 [Bacteroidales bacterium]